MLPLKPSRQMSAGFRVYPQGKHIWGVSRQMLALGADQEAAALRGTTAQTRGPGGRVGGTAPRGMLSRLRRGRKEEMHPRKNGLRLFVPVLSWKSPALRLLKMLLRSAPSQAVASLAKSACPGRRPLRVTPGYTIGLGDMFAMLTCWQREKMQNKILNLENNTW